MQRIRTCLLLLLAIQVVLCPTARAAENTATREGEAREDRLLERIDFGNSYIRGQTIQSGAVYLLQRKKSDIESLLQPRESYRQEILQDFHMQQETKQPAETVDSK